MISKLTVEIKLRKVKGGFQITTRIGHEDYPGGHEIKFRYSGALNAQARELLPHMAVNAFYRALVTDKHIDDHFRRMSR